MNLKIFLVPLSIALMIWASIGIISPKYSEVQLLRESLKKEAENLNNLNVQEKNKNKLVSDLEANSKQKDILLKYLPREANYEEIVDNLNFISKQNNLLAYDISVEKEEAPSGISLAKAVSDASVDEDGTIANPKAAAKASASLSGVRNIYVSFGAVGAYENVRTMLDQISKLKRFNQIVNLKIDKVKNGEEKDDGVDYPSSNNLQMTATIAFNYAPKISASNNLNNAIFSSDALDISVADKIEKRYTMSISDLKVDPTDRPNIFSLP